MVTTVLAIILCLYFLCSSIGMSIILKDEDEDISFKLFIFGLLVLPIAILHEIWDTYKKGDSK